MRGKLAKFTPSDRNKASELLGRSEADFTDNLAHDLKTPLVDMFAMIAAKKKK